MFLWVAMSLVSQNFAAKVQPCISVQVVTALGTIWGLCNSFIDMVLCILKVLAHQLIIFQDCLCIPQCIICLTHLWCDGPETDVLACSLQDFHSTWDDAKKEAVKLGLGVEEQIHARSIGARQ